MKTKTKLILLLALTLSFVIANTVSGNFFQGFETDNSGWNAFGGQYDATRVPTGTHGITSHTGSFHAEAPGPYQLCDTSGSAATNWGGYSRPFPIAGYTTDVWVYLNMAATTVNDRLTPFYIRGFEVILLISLAQRQGVTDMVGSPAMNFLFWHSMIHH